MVHPIGHISIRADGHGGYRHKIKVRQNPRKTHYVMYARYMMECKIGRKLRPDEIVHHINRDPLDDRIENLQLVSRGEHNRIHLSGVINWSTINAANKQRIANCKKERIRLQPEILKLYNSGYGVWRIGSILNKDGRTIQRILNETHNETKKESNTRTTGYL